MEICLNLSVSGCFSVVFWSPHCLLADSRIRRCWHKVKVVILTCFLSCFQHWLCIFGGRFPELFHWTGQMCTVSLGSSELPFLLQVRAWKGVGTNCYSSLIIYRVQIIRVFFSWILIKGYMENFRKKLCSLEVSCMWCQPLSFSESTRSRIQRSDILLAK